MDERFHTLGFRVQLTEDEGVWVASATRIDTGDTFGPPVPGDRADEAADLLARWLEWQQAHTTALAALQDAEASYQRLAAGEFAAREEQQRQARRTALMHVDDMRRQLDAVREQRPWPR
jgi:hypothetical protein